MTGKLYIVATPIGNLEDITLRATKILSDVDIVLAEDTRVTKKLLDFVYSYLPSEASVKDGQPLATNHRSQTKTLLLSYHQHSGEGRRLEILSYLLDGKDIALVTDAGTPGISDPGNELVEYLLSYNPEIEVVPIPGASSLTSALSVSGFRTDKFLFLGYWPKKKVSKVLETIKSVKCAVVYYDSPHRVLKNLQTLEKAMGGHQRVLVAREMTKLHETMYRGTIKEVIAKLMQEKRIRGELVMVVEGDR